MRIAEGHIELIKAELRNLSVVGVKPEDHNWYLVANELVKLHEKELEGANKLKNARKSLQSAEEELSHIQEKEAYLQKLFEKVNAEREERKNAKQLGE